MKDMGLTEEFFITLQAFLSNKFGGHYIAEQLQRVTINTHKSDHEYS